MNKFIKLSVVALAGLTLTACGSNNSSDSSSSNKTTDSNSAAKSSKKEANVPSEYTAALNKAKTYLSFDPMSKKGLYNQLTSQSGEKFKPDAANYAIKHLTDVDWNKQALKKAEIYQKQMSMSKDAIKQQLTSGPEGFTESQANYAISHLK